ncbi:MAG: hypothetical protein RR547_03395 [Raoultibacter sp.]
MARTVEEVPLLINHVIVYGRILKAAFSNEEVYVALGTVALASKQKDQLREIKTTEIYFLDQTMKLSTWMSEYIEDYEVQIDRKILMGFLI